MKYIKFMYKGQEVVAAFSHIISHSDMCCAINSIPGAECDVPNMSAAFFTTDENGNAKVGGGSFTLGIEHKEGDEDLIQAALYASEREVLL